MSSSFLRVALAALLLYLLLTAAMLERLYLSLFQFGILGLTAIFLIRNPRQPPAVKHYPSILVLLALPASGVVQVAAGLSVYPWRTAVAALDWTVWVAVAWLSFQAFARPDSSAELRKWMALTGLVISAFSILHWYTSEDRILWYWPNPYAHHSPFPLMNHGHFAAFVELALGAAVWEALRLGRYAQLYGWAVALMFAAVFMFGSRSGAAIVTVELIGLLLLAVRFSPSAISRRRAVQITILSGIAVAAIGWQGIAARFTAPPRDEIRPLLAAATLDMIEAKPVTGFGLGTWNVVYPAYARIDPGMFVEHAHNDWLEWAAEGGLPFMLLIVWLAVLSLRRSLNQPWCLGITAVFIQSLIDFPLQKPAIIAILFAMVGSLGVKRLGTIRTI